MEQPIEETLSLKERAQAYVTKTWNVVKSAYTVYRNSCFEARLRYSNQQWIEFHDQTRTWRRQAPDDPWVPTPNINRFGPWMDGIMSNFNAIPEVEAIPKPIDDPIKMGIADVANKLAQHAIEDNALRSDFGSREDRSNTSAGLFTLSGCVFTTVRLHQKQTGERPQLSMQPVTNMQCLACGAAYPNLQQPMPMCPDCGSDQVTVEESEAEMPTMGEDGQPQLEPIMEPRVIVDVGDPVAFCPRPGSTSMDNTGYLISARRMSVDEIHERTGLDAKPDNEQPDNIMLSQSDLAYWYLGYQANPSAENEHALFVEFWCEPGKIKEFPEGCYAVYFNEEVQHVIPWAELKCEDHPVTKFDFEPMPGIFFPRAKAFDLCEIQRSLTQLDCLIELHLKTSATEPIVIDKNSMVSEITGRADKVVYWQGYAPGVKEPHRMQHGVLDPAMYQRQQYLEEKGESIAATVSVFRGEQPGSVTAASAISQLRGQAEMQFAKPVKNWNNGWKETIRKCILYYQHSYTIDQLAEIVGKDKLTQISDFTQCDLNDCLEFTATSNGLPRTRDERRQEMMVLFDKGALDLTDPNVRQKVFELFGETGLMKNFNADATRARMNVRTMKETGQMAMFRPGIDDPGIHLSIATEAAKNLDFDQWPPPSQQALIAYVEGLNALEAQAAAAEAAQQNPPNDPSPSAATPQPEVKVL